MQIGELCSLFCCLVSSSGLPRGLIKCSEGATKGCREAFENGDASSWDAYIQDPRIKSGIVPVARALRFGVRGTASGESRLKV